MLLSVIVPVLNEEAVVEQTFRTLKAVLANVEHELVFVNDGSTDRTAEILTELMQEFSGNQLIHFSRNFGHQAAFSAGMKYARGQAVVIIDGDLQDPPELILQMLQKWRQGYQVVYAQRNKRQGETFFKKITAKFFYRFLNAFTNVNIPVDTGDFRLMDREVVNHINSLPERSRFLRGLVCWVGFKHTGILYDRAERFAGDSKYPLSKMIRLALDGITSFGSSPLKLSFLLGIFTSILGAIGAIYALISWAFFPERIEAGWTSLIIAVLFMGGIQLITIGILGEYIGRIYDEVKQRPLYIAQKNSIIQTPQQEDCTND
jgi:polyisoprenyl-phosphate glycosyltransferase